MKNVALTLTKLSVISTAIQNGEYDFDGTKEETPVQPILLRAEQVKAEVKEATGIRYKLEAKDLEIKDFRKGVKSKQEELSEMQVRKDLLEKKLIDSNRDHDLIVEKLQRKLDDSNNLMKRKEKEFEETMDHLQADIDSLENERGELKDKMKQMSKKALLQGLAKEPKVMTVEAGGPTSLGPSVPSPIRDSPLLVQQVSDMRAAVNSLQQSKARIQGNYLRERLARLKPIHIPKPQITIRSDQEKADASKDPQDQDKELGDQLSQLIRRCGAARSELYSLLCSQQIVDVSKPKGNLARKDAKDQKARQIREKSLRAEISLLQLEMTKLLASRLDNGTTVPSSFGSFASTGASKAINEKEYSLMGQVCVLGKEDPKEKSSDPSQSVPLIINIQQLKQIHASFLH
jgi:dynactin 1